MQITANVQPDDRIGSQSVGFFQLGDALHHVSSNVATIGIIKVFLNLERQSLSGCQKVLNNADSVVINTAISNRGFASPKKKRITLDNTDTELVLIELTLPAGMAPDNAVSGQTDAGRVILLLKDTDSWISLRNWDGVASVERIALALHDDALHPQSIIDAGFDLVVVDEAQLPIEIPFTLTVDTNADGQSNFNTSMICINDDPVPLPGVNLRFIKMSDKDIDAVDYNAINAFENATPYILNDEPIYQLPGDGVYLEMDASRLNQDSVNKETLVIDLLSRVTTDAIRLTLLETTIDSGLFRSVAAVVLSSEEGESKACTTSNENPVFDGVLVNGCLLKSTLGDRIQAHFVDTDNRVDVTATAQVVNDYTVKQHLLGTVYGIGSNEIKELNKLANVEVRVHAIDDPYQAAARMRTNDNGQYRFEGLPHGQYFLTVSSDNGYEFPSEIDQSLITETHGEILPAAYGKDGYLGKDKGSGIITLAATGEPIVINIPLDKEEKTGRLAITKTVSTEQAEIGDRVKYQIQIRNISKQTARGVVLEDKLPFGFKYEKGSLKLDGKKIQPSTLTPMLIVPVEDLAYQQTITLTYVTKLTVGALDSDGINRAVAKSHETRSDTATAKVKVRQQGLLSDKAFIFGKLFIDNNCDSQQEAREWPVAGVRIYLEDGSFVITDENGQYSFYGIRPGLHVLKLDRTTLPPHLEPYPLDNSFAADDDSRFLDVSAGDFHRADFAFTCPDIKYRADVYGALKARNESINGDWLLSEALQFKGTFETTGHRYNEQNKKNADMSSGILTKSVVDPEASRPVDATDVNRQNQKAMPSAKSVAEGLDQAVAKKGLWVWPEGNISLDGKLMYAVRQGVRPELYINGNIIDEKHLGEDVQVKQQSLQVHTWYRLPFKDGNNRVEVKAIDPFGNQRVLLKEKNIYQPGAGVSLQITPLKKTLEADRGRSSIGFDIEILDQFNHRAKGLDFVTLYTSEGTWLEQDIQTETQGHQIRLINGYARVNLQSSLYQGQVDIRAEWQTVEAKTQVMFVEPVRPLLAVGFLSLGASANLLDNRTIVPSRQADGFDQTFNLDGQSALFLKGKIKGDMLLTLSYDNKKTSDTELLRDIDPEAYYPIYGDASIKGYDAQSRSKLYVKLEKSGSAIMWGDFTTDNQIPIENSLGRISQTLTGATGHTKQGIVTLKGYAASVDKAEKTEEISANGTATFYQIQHAPIVPGSESIEIITRDLENPGLIISTQQLARNQDYVLDDASGHLRLFEPLTSTDIQPTFLRIHYQSEKPVDAHLVSGVSTHVQVSKHLDIGASYQNNDDRESGFGLTTAHINLDLNNAHQVTAEAAHQAHKADNYHDGKAVRVELRNKWHRTLQSRLTYARANKGFDNPDASITKARQEIKLNSQYDVLTHTSINLDINQSESLEIDESRLSAGIDVKQRLGDWAITLGSRHINQVNQYEHEDLQTGRIRVDKGLTVFGRNASLFVDYEQDLSNSARNAWSVGTEYELTQTITTYVSHDVIASFSGVTSLTTGQQTAYTQAGFRAAINDHSQAYSELRLRGGMDARGMQAVQGFRSRFEIEKGLDFMPSAELVNQVHGDSEDTDEGYSLSLSLNDFRSANVKKAIRVENRQTESSFYYAINTSYAARLNQNWTSLYMNNLYFDDGKKGLEDKFNNVLTLGSAYRPRLTNTWHALFFYQWKKQINLAEDSRNAHIVSTHHNINFSGDYTVMARLAVKLQNQAIDDQQFKARVFLTGLRLQKRLDWRWDIDLRVGFLSSDFMQDRRYSIGVGANYLLDKNLRLGLSYNFTGFEERDLDAQGYYGQGIKLGIQFKFDEDLFKWLQ